ncbi:MAG: GatB/YqeY domain-containing protein [Lachnospiraceae bacterium]|nr:GatB/YqeY domain-containing protein [Lachnospiraceae bacterium]
MLVNDVHKEMMNALKDGNKDRKNTLSLLVDALNKAAKEKMAELTVEEENSIVLKMIKQLKETIDTCPADRTDISNKANEELAIISEFAPKQMDEAEINNVIDDVLRELNIETPTNKDKGQIMRLLMPRVKGQADGKLVNSLLAKRF